MDKKNLEGGLDHLKGKVKETVGVATGDRELEGEGKVDQVKGKIKESVGEMNDDEQLRQEGEAQHDAGHVEEAFGKGRRKVGDAIKDVADKIGH